MTDKNDTSEWAEGLSNFGPDTVVSSGEGSRAEVRKVVEAALGGPDAVKRAVGRPSLPGSNPGENSKVIQIRVGDDLDREITRRTGGRKGRRSPLVREALVEYFERHPA